MSKENENVLWCIAHSHSHSHQEKRSDLGGEPWNYRAGSQGIFDLSRGSSLGMSSDWKANDQKESMADQEHKKGFRKER